MTWYKNDNNELNNAYTWYASLLIRASLFTNQQHQHTDYEYDLKPLLGGEVHQPIDNQLMDQQQPSDGDEEVDEDQFDDTQVIEEEQDEEGEEAEEYKEEEAEENEDFKEQEEEELDEPDTYFDDYGSKSINENQDDLQPSDKDLYPE
ncbi:hypothetical protein TSAR_009003 [Trichomalopsis sarcophagae]|uniref:Uncharacterized protein n=1 Tax=Trichomalopsis sarcophagae TaxID=543379 RepID=A0A232EFC7_9HYME|nr:hypothetical protein TSAR_009003 [Trichomalopsis sarcophagae]